MSKERSKVVLNKHVIDEAAEWFVELNEGETDIAVRQQFDTWLRASPEHMRAYLRMLPIWEDGSRVDTEVDGDPQALIAWARAADNIIPLTAVSAEKAQQRGVSSGKDGASRRIQAVKLSLMAAATAIAIVGTWHYTQRNTYTTGIGEQRLIALADGSKVELNSRSRMTVRFTDHARDVDLIEGQALFRVAKDKARPFIVRSADTEVRAVGTQFDIYRKRSGTIVTVVEGRVAVAHPGKHEGTPLPSVGKESPHFKREGEVLLNAGEQITVPSVARKVVAQPKRTDVAVATAWTQQRLVFSRTPLADAAEEFNRYNTRQIIVEGSGLQTFIVSGTFSSTDPTSLVRFLRKQPNIRVQETSSKILIGEN